MLNSRKVDSQDQGQAITTHRVLLVRKDRRVATLVVLELKVRPLVSLAVLERKAPLVATLAFLEHKDLLRGTQEARAPKGQHKATPVALAPKVQPKDTQAVLERKARHRATREVLQPKDQHRATRAAQDLPLATPLVLRASLEATHRPPTTQHRPDPAQTTQDFVPPAAAKATHQADQLVPVSQVVRVDDQDQRPRLTRATPRNLTENTYLHEIKLPDH